MRMVQGSLSYSSMLNEVWQDFTVASAWLAAGLAAAWLLCL